METLIKNSKIKKLGLFMEDEKGGAAHGKSIVIHGSSLFLEWDGLFCSRFCLFCSIYIQFFPK